MGGSIVGREAELQSLRDFVAGISGGATALVLDGEAGMGKTTLWAAALAEARVRVLEARPTESETALSFSGLGDLLEPVVDEALAGLPGAQRRALAVALVLEESERPLDARVVGVAALNALRSLATEAPLVVAIDDVQWLDPASEAALAYAARRLTDEPVGVLLARRTGHDSALVHEVARTFAADRFRWVPVEPLRIEALGRVVHDHLGVALPRPLLAEVHDASGGNPFYALEIVRMLQRSGVSPAAHRRLPVPEPLRDLVRERLLDLPPPSRDYLLAAAAMSQPTVSLVEAASGVGRAEGLAPALEAGVVDLESDRLRFAHPLLAAGAYEAADPMRRRAVHARLADLVDDAEARALHLAASVADADESVARALEEAAAAARARGAPRAGALLLERARELTPADLADDAARRAVDAAYLHYESGDSPRAEAQLRGAIERLPPGRQRARALMRLARVRAYVALTEAAELFLQALDEADGDPRILAVAHEGVATSFFRLYERLPESIEHSKLAAGFALEIGDDALAAEALGTQWTVELLTGRDFSETRRRALALQDAADDLRVLAQPRFAEAASQLWLVDSLPQARDDFVEMLRRAGELGDESSRPLILAHLAVAECDLGHLEAAVATAVEGREAASQSGQETVLVYCLAAEGLAEAYRGRSERARELTARALELTPHTVGGQPEFVATSALAHLALSEGAAETAAAALAPSVEFVRQQGIEEPGLAPFVTDYVQALVELGRREDAVEVLDWYEGNARRLGRASALAASLHCRGLLASQTGAVDEAIRVYQEALAIHERVEPPLPRGRTLLALGAALRRAKRRREARATLEGAVALFEEIGAELWAERARAELRRVSGRAARAGELTPAEARVAELVAEGKTNREVAAALFLSERTVEGHLSRVYGKLGVRSRVQLARAFGPGKV